MIGIAGSVILQAAEVGPELERLIRVQTVTAVATAMLALAALGLIAAALWLLRSVRGMLRSAETAIERLAGRAEPIVDRAARLAEHASEIGALVRRDVQAFHETLEDVDRRVRAAVDGVDARVRRLAAVLDIVQQEATELLLDAAATARGLHVAARRLTGRRPPRRRVGLRPEREGPEEEPEEEPQSAAGRPEIGRAHV